MSYIHKSGGVKLIGAGAADDLTAAAVHSDSLAITRRMTVNRIMALVSTLVAADLTAPVVTFKRRPTYGSAAGEVTIGTITIPDGAAVGKVYYKEVTPVDLLPGDQLVFEVTTAATDSGVAAGGAIYDVELDEDPEVPGNESDMIESA